MQVQTGNMPPSQQLLPIEFGYYFRVLQLHTQLSLEPLIQMADKKIQLVKENDLFFNEDNELSEITFL